MQPWERRGTESPQAWAAFQHYRDLGPERSTAKVAQDSGKHKSLMDGWSSQHEWVKRAAAWDAHLDAIIQTRIAKERGEMAVRQMRLGKALQEKAKERLEGIETAALEPKDVAAWMKAGVDIERLAGGEATEIKEHKLSDQTREKLKHFFADEEAKT